MEKPLEVYLIDIDTNKNMFLSASRNLVQRQKHVNCNNSKINM